MTYDISNAAGTFTNQQGNLTGVFYDTNRLTFTTNYFQSDNIGLANGANVITFHATDWAGNETNVSFTISFTPSTNPPVLTLVWPQGRTTVIGTNFTLQARVSDPTATVTASANGATTWGLVEADGSIWVQNLALQPGTNTVVLAANTALGGLAATNFTVTVADLGLTVAPWPYFDWNQNSIIVNGSISDINTNTLYVNGVQASEYYLGPTTWTAQGVPVNPYGVATLSMQVSNAVLAGSQNFYQAEPTTVAMKSYSGHQVFTTPEGSLDEPDNINWFYNTGGALNDSLVGIFPITAATNGEAYMYNVGPFSMPWEYADIPNENGCENHIQTRVMLEPGGIAQAGTTNAYLVFATAREFSDTNINNGGAAWPYIGFIPYWPANGINQYLPYGGDVGLPPEWLQINGQTLFNTGVADVTAPSNGNPPPNITSLWGATIVSAAAGETPDITPVAARVYQNWDYTFDVQAYPIHMQILDANGNDLTLQTNTVIVGQQMNLTCQLSFTNAFYTNTFIATNFSWTVPGVAISNYVVAADSSSAFVLTNYPLNNSNAVFYWVDGASNRVVQCSATVNGTPIMGQTTFNVLRPSIDWVGSINDNVGYDTNYFASTGGLKWLHFGGSRSNGVTIPGIICLSTNVNVNGIDQTYGFINVQTITFHTNALTHNDGSVTVTSKSGLDNRFPTQLMGDGDGDVFSDLPGIAYTTNDLANAIGFLTSQRFKATLMFQPFGGLWVPIKDIDWGWSGAVTLTNAQSTLISSNATIYFNNQNTFDFPVWTNVVLTTVTNQP